MRCRPSFRRDENGVVAIEFAVLAVPFFLILLAIMELSLVLLASIQIEDATDRVSRQMMVGQVNRDQGAIRSAVCGAMVIKVTCSNLKIDYREYQSVDSFALEAPVVNRTVNAAAFKFATSTNRSFVSLRVGYEWPIVIGPMARLFAGLNNGKTFIMGTSLMRVQT